MLKWQNQLFIKTERGEQSVQSHEANVLHVTSSVECFIVQPPDIAPDLGMLTLRDEEAHHATRSLRLRVGDELFATDLEGTCYRCHIQEATSGIVTCPIEEVLPNYGESALDLTLLVGVLAQPSRWEFVLEKSTELGVRTIQPLLTERTERAQLRPERSDKILRAAVKQTKRARIPTLLSALSFSEALAKTKESGKPIILLHESAAVQNSLMHALEQVSGQPIAIAVGPEGGFSEEEVAMATDTFGVSVVSLGTRRLRAETAAIAAIAIAMSVENP